IDQSVENRNDIPDHQKSSVSNTIVNSLEQNLKEEAGSGLDLSKLMSLFSNNNTTTTTNSNTNSGFYQKMQSSIVSALTGKLGLNPTIANSIVASILPGLITTLANKFGANNMVGNLLGKIGL
ncbi:MAG: hypothetical protein LIO93_07910, partial [Bacteroidales bacterium]|nr:hypothetical protein [Bacteroidales bacterium]